MRERGFANHAVMGAIFLGAMWFAIYLPKIWPAIRMGGWPAWLAIAVGLTGVFGGPLLLVFIEGDEIFGALGIVVALLTGWASARFVTLLRVSSTTMESVRLCGAALGPILLYGCFQLISKAVQKKR